VVRLDVRLRYGEKVELTERYVQVKEFFRAISVATWICSEAR
jgi:hypothetical protein